MRKALLIQKQDSEGASFFAVVVAAAVVEVVVLVLADFVVELEFAVMMMALFASEVGCWLQ